MHPITQKKSQKFHPKTPQNPKIFTKKIPNFHNKKPKKSQIFTTKNQKNPKFSQQKTKKIPNFHKKKNKKISHFPNKNPPFFADTNCGFRSLSGPANCSKRPKQANWGTNRGSGVRFSAFLSGFSAFLRCFDLILVVFDQF
jgi:hypothetical protein